MILDQHSSRTGVALLHTPPHSEEYTSMTAHLQMESNAHYIIEHEETIRDIFSSKDLIT